MKITGIFTNFTIKDHDLFMSYIIKKRKFQKNYMIIVYKKNGQIKILLQNGKKLDMRDCVVWDAFKQEIIILQEYVFAEFQKQNYNRVNKLIVNTVDVKDVLVEIDIFIYNIIIKTIKMIYIFEILIENSFISIFYNTISYNFI